MLHLSVCSGRAPFRSFMFALHACYVISIALVLFVKLHGLEEEPGKLLLSPLTHKLWLLSQCDTKSRPASSRASSYFCQGKIFARISIPELEMGKCVSFLDARCASIAGTGTKENLSFWEKLTFLYFFFFIFFWGGGCLDIGCTMTWIYRVILSYISKPKWAVHTPGLNSLVDSTTVWDSEKTKETRGTYIPLKTYSGIFFATILGISLLGLLLTY